MNLYVLSDFEIIKKIGEKIKKIRLEKNLSQEDVARLSGLGRKTISNIESGKPFSFLALVRFLRSIESLELLKDIMTIEEVLSPQKLYKESPKKKKRASRSRVNINNKKEPKSEW